MTYNNQVEGTPEQVAAFCVALCAAQAAALKVAKTTANDTLGSRYADLNGHIAASADVLKENGLAVLTLPSHINGAPALATTVTHQAGGTLRSIFPMLIASRTDMQGLGAAITYGRRYIIGCLLNMQAVDDNGQEATDAKRGENFARSIAPPALPFSTGQEPATTVAAHRSAASTMKRIQKIATAPVEHLAQLEALASNNGEPESIRATARNRIAAINAAGNSETPAAAESIAAEATGSEASQDA